MKLHVPCSNIRDVKFITAGVLQCDSTHSSYASVVLLFVPVMRLIYLVLLLKTDKLHVHFLQHV